MRSVAMVVGGTSMMVAGAALAVTCGFLMLIVLNGGYYCAPNTATTCTRPVSGGMIGLGFGIGGGAVMFVGGLPLIIVGALKVSADQPAVWLAPTGIAGRF